MRNTLTFLTVLTAAHAAVVKPELPQWSDEDRKAVTAHTLVPGWDLLGTESGAKPGPADVPPPTAAEMAGDSARSREVPERFLEPYFGSRPQSYVVDPQGLLDSHAAKDREGFLRYHAADSKIDLYVYLFGPDQEIPGSVRSEEITERFFSEGKPAVVVYYFLGAPDRSEIRVSPLLSDSVSGAEQRRALSTSLAQALEKKDPTAQFEAFCVQMSIRLYWMERVAGLVAIPADAVPVATRASAPAEEAHSELKDRLKGYADRWALPFGMVAGAALLLGGGIWMQQLRRRYRFPDFEIPARLGGSHGAGIGAVISFGSTGQSPSSQRQEVPDYLGL